MREEVSGLDLADCSLDQLAKLPALIVIDGSFQILNFRCVLSNKHDKGNLGNVSQPGITNELRIERQETIGLFRISGCRRFPIDDAFPPIHLADRVDVRHEITATRKRARQLYLKILFWVSDLNAIILSEPFE
jgi:hypothetical protein